jgi:hypothetical protein
MKGFRRSRVALLTPAVVLIATSSCHHKPTYVEAPPRWRWANVGKNCTLTAPANELPVAAGDTFLSPFGPPGRGDNWAHRAAISRHIPGGWGGLELRETGRPYGIYLLDTTQRSAALAALLAAGVDYISVNTKVVQGRWTYWQIYDWFRYIHSHLRHVAVNMWTLDEWHNRILYGTVDEAAALELNRQLTALNVPCFLVAREVIGEIRILSGQHK